MSRTRKKKRRKKEQAQLRWVESYHDNWIRAFFTILGEFWRDLTSWRTPRRPR